MSYCVDNALICKIDEINLSKANQEWRSAMRAAPWRVFTDRERWTVKSWRETEGEDLQIRRAKLLECILDNIEIKIHDFDEIVKKIKIERITN